ARPAALGAGREERAGTGMRVDAQDAARLQREQRAPALTGESPQAAETRPRSVAGSRHDRAVAAGRVEPDDAAQAPVRDENAPSSSTNPLGHWKATPLPIG